MIPKYERGKNFLQFGPGAIKEALSMLDEITLELTKLKVTQPIYNCQYTLYSRVLESKIEFLYGILLPSGFCYLNRSELREKILKLQVDICKILAFNNVIFKVDLFENLGKFLKEFKQTIISYIDTSLEEKEYYNYKYIKKHSSWQFRQADELLPRLTLLMYCCYYLYFVFDNKKIPFAKSSCDVFILTAYNTYALRMTISEFGYVYKSPRLFAKDLNTIRMAINKMLAIIDLKDTYVTHLNTELDKIDTLYVFTSKTCKLCEILYQHPLWQEIQKVALLTYTPIEIIEVYNEVNEAKRFMLYDLLQVPSVIFKDKVHYINMGSPEESLREIENIMKAVGVRKQVRKKANRKKEQKHKQTKQQINKNDKQQQILLAMTKSENFTIDDIVTLTKLPRTTIQFHLKELMKAGKVANAGKSNRSKLYALNYGVNSSDNSEGTENNAENDSQDMDQETSDNNEKKEPNT